MVAARLTSIAGFLAVSLMIGSCGQDPTSGDVTGPWKNADGAELTLKEDGTFVAASLPLGIFTSPDRKGPAFGGTGIWRLKKGRPYWEVKLRFEEIDERPASREVTVLVSESGRSTYLYQWRDDEGGARYRLKRH